MCGNVWHCVHFASGPVLIVVVVCCKGEVDRSFIWFIEATHDLTVLAIFVTFDFNCRLRVLFP